MRQPIIIRELIREPTRREPIQDKERIMRIPELPRGRRLKLEILNNHGDMRYVGMGAIEIYDDGGVNISPGVVVSALHGQGTIPLDQFSLLGGFILHK
jgi:hypothetical protein